MRKYFLLAAFLSLFIRVYAADSSLHTKVRNNIILIGWDAADRSVVKRALEKKDLPNLAALVSKGSLVKIDVIRATDTSAGWAQILTGYEPEKTRVFCNHAYRAIPKGFTIFERLKDFYGNEFISAAVINKKKNIGFLPRRIYPVKNELNLGEENSFARRISRHSKIYYSFPADPYLFASQRADYFLNDLKYDKAVGEKTLELLGKIKDKKFFLFVHFGDGDSAVHKSGGDSKAYYQALLAQDAWLGKIMEQLKKLGIDKNTLIYVTSDHGFDVWQRFHFDAPYVFLASNDPKVIRKGTRCDIAPTLLERLGIDISKIQPALDGHSLLHAFKDSDW